MKKIKDALVLFAITLIAGLLLGAVNEVTKDPIAQQEIEKNAEAYRTVSPDAKSFEATDAVKGALERAESLMAEHSELGNAVIEDAVEALDASGNFVGYVVKSTSKDGYAGAITVAVGISSEGTVTGIDFLVIGETAGLGMKATEPDFKDQFKDKTVEAFEVTKSGAATENEIDAISGATYTSEAVTNAVNAAIVFAADCMGQ